MIITHTTPPISNYPEWSELDVACALLAKTKEGGLGMSIGTTRKLCVLLAVKGTTLNKIIEGKHKSEEWFRDYMDDLDYIEGWFKERLKTQNTITKTIDVFDWFCATQKVRDESIPHIIGKMVEKIEFDFDEEKYQEIVEKARDEMSECLGGIASKKVDWPIVVYETVARLDWRFSTHILSSPEETKTIDKLRKGNLPSLLEPRPSFPNTKEKVRKLKPEILKTSHEPPQTKQDSKNESIHEFIAEKIKESDTKIFVLLALSGAGKSHTLFYLNTSNTSFTLPIDFGSVEDKPILLADSYDYIVTQVKKLTPNPLLQQDIEDKNKLISDEIQAEIATLFSLRGLMLLKLLRIRKQKNQTLLPSMWIRFLYHSGSSINKKLYQTWKVHLRSLNKTEAFLKQILIELDTELQSNPLVTCKQVVLSVDEINPLVKLGHGDNKIRVGENSCGSVATLLFRLLESSSSVSVVSGTKIDTTMLQMVVSSRLKEKISVIPYYGPTSLKALRNFTSHYFYTPNINFYSDSLFNACCTILQGRRRAFIKFLTEIVNNARHFPFPSETQEIENWKRAIILNAFMKYPPNEFRTDINNFLTEGERSKDNEALHKTRIDVSLYLILKNSLQSQDLERIIQHHFQTNQAHLKDSLILSIIYHGISFGTITENDDNLFESTEVVNAIHLNQVLRNNLSNAKELVNYWLIQAFEGNHTDRKVLGNLFEIIGALILLDIGKVLDGKSLTSHPLFEEAKGTFLDDYTLPSSLSIVKNKNYWRVFVIFKKWTDSRTFNSFFRDVVAFGLDEQLKVNVKTLLIPISKGTEGVKELNMTSKFISNPNHEDEFKNNFHGSDYRNAYLCNDWNTIQPHSKNKRNLFIKHYTNENETVFQDSTLRIVFDYTYENMATFEQLRRNVSNGDVVILFSNANPAFENYFQNTFSDIRSTILKYLKMSK